MAQAARLNLRMQRELKLLLTDPPPGAFFPFLSADSDLSSLSTIRAQIEGPEGSVYAKGVFEITIQVPERYPFQPPSVTFGTPIYHPNIDNGGRICLDILNLPPKGAWQPSLNISTVLTSIGLLLSEPNPDDGLMCEASREYKYNRQAFDLKAKSMTDKYAKAGAGGSSCSDQGVQSLNPSVGSRHEVNEIVSNHMNPWGISQKLSLGSSSSIQCKRNDGELNEIDAKGKRKEVNVTYECNLRQERLCGTRRKLSLESSCQIQKRNGHEKENVVANQSSVTTPTIFKDYSGSSVLRHNICSQQIQHIHDTSESMIGSLNMSSEKPCQLNHKKAPFDTTPASSGNNLKICTKSQVLLFQSHSNSSQGTSSMALPANSTELQPHNEVLNRMRNGSTDTCKRPFHVGKKLSLGSKGSSQAQEKDNKEKVAPIHKMLVSSPKNSCRNSGIGQKLSLGSLTLNNDINSQVLPPSENLSMDGMSLPLREDNGCNKRQCSLIHDAKCIGEQQKREGSPIPEAVVVLDSEDSDEEMGGGALRSKLFPARKRKGNWRDRRAKV